MYLVQGTCHYERKSMKQNYFFRTSMIFITGLTAGYIVNLFMSSGVKNKHRQQLVEIKNRISPESFDEITTSLFGASTKEMATHMDEILSQFQEQVASIKAAADSFDRKKYQKLIDDFSDRMQSDYDFSTEQIERLRSFLKSDYQKVLQALSKSNSKD
jgi:hypothetical protein